MLSRLCLFKTRSQAGRACDEGRVWWNGQPARASREVRSGDRIRFRDARLRFEEEVEILEVPEKPVSKAASRELYRRIERRAIEDPGDLLE